LLGLKATRKNIVRKFQRKKQQTPFEATQNHYHVKKMQFRALGVNFSTTVKFNVFSIKKIEK